MPKDLDVFCVTISARLFKAAVFINAPSEVPTLSMIVSSQPIESVSAGIQSFFTPVLLTTSPANSVILTQCPPIKLDRKGTNSKMIDDLYVALYSLPSISDGFIDVIFEGYLP